MRVLLILVLLVLANHKASGQLLINELLSSNVNGILDEDGDFDDWIEIYNTGVSAVDLANFSLSDDIDIPQKWTFPSIDIPAQGHILVFASGKDRKNPPVSYQTIIDQGSSWRYLIPNSDIGTDWHNTGFIDSAWNTGSSGFGYADDDDGTILPNGILSVFIRREFTITDLASIQKLILHVDYDDGFVAYINGAEVARVNIGSVGELVTFDATTVVDHEATIYLGGSPDMFEISNPSELLVEGTNIISIQGHNVSTTSSDLSLIPFLTIATTSGEPNDISSYLSFPEQEGLHTNFKLKSEGESLYLYNTSGTLEDSVSAILIPSDVSFGRKPDGGSEWLFFGEPTPGQTNSTVGVEEILSNTVHFSISGGKYSGGLSISLSTENVSDTIYYTTDGSIPTTSSQFYSSPIYVVEDIVIRTRVINSNALPGPVTTNSYFTQYDHKLPILSLSTNPENLWDDDIGIYILGPTYESQNPHYGANYWEEWERPMHLELFDEDGIKQIDQVAGAKIFGGWSRMAEQKSMALYARKVYGKGSFSYQIFKDKPIDKYETMVLRNSGNDNLQLQFHDCFMTGLTRDMNVDRQAFQPVSVYLNGAYWGVMNIREKVNEHFITENHLVDVDEINLLEQAGGEVYGSNQDYLDILSYIDVNTDLANSEKYTWMKDRIDINNYIQYQLTQIYLNNQDWPGNNIKFWNTNTGNKWRWILYDTDFGFMRNEVGENTLNFALVPDFQYGWPNPPWSTLLFRRMVTNMEFRNNFIIQYCDRLNVDFSPSRVSTDLDSLRQLYYTDMGFHFNRWGGSYNDWQQRINDRIIFGDNRPGIARGHMMNQFSLGEVLEIDLDVSDKSAGKIKINTVYPYDYPFTGKYFKDIAIQLTAVPNPGFKFVKWEGTQSSNLYSISYNMAADGSFKAIFEEAGVEDISIVINEINYSSSEEYDTKDWVELVNNCQATIDMEGWLISDSGIDTGHYFPAGVTLSPGEYLVVCKDSSAFRENNPNISNVTGDLPFGLSGNGDLVLLYDKDGNLMDAVEYYPYAPWPQNADGTGATIELIDPILNNTLGANWQASGVRGTPGGPNSGFNNIESPMLSTLTNFECFPNPFTDFTTIQFTVASEGNYRLEIYDINGRLLEVLSDEFLMPGTYSVDWLGNNRFNEDLPGGIYTVRLSSENNIETLKLIMLK